MIEINFKEQKLADLYHEHSIYLRNIRLAVNHWNLKEYDFCEKKCRDIIEYAEEKLWPCLWVKEMLGNIHYIRNELVPCLKYFSAILEEDPLAISTRYYLMRYFPSSLIIGISNNRIVLDDFLNSQPKNWIKFLNPADFCYYASVLPVSDLKKIVLPTDPVEKMCIAMANNFQKEESFTWFEKFYKNNKENIWIGIEKSELFAADVKNNFRMPCTFSEIFKIAKIMKNHNPFSIETQVVLDQLKDLVTGHNITDFNSIMYLDTDSEEIQEAQAWLNKEFKIS